MKKLNNKGFTLIEVVLVLAIGGLIFLLAFLAFQQVSKNRRDMQRRSNLGLIVAELQNFKTNTGRYPGIGDGLAAGIVFSGFANDYTENLKRPTGEEIICVNADVFSNCTPTNEATPYSTLTGSSGLTDQFYKGFNEVCSPNASTAPVTSSGNVVVAIRLESGAVVCRDTSK